MILKFGPWRYALWLCLIAFLAACGQSHDAERLMALAEKAEHDGQLTVAADLAHQAARRKPHDFGTQYGAALLELQAGHFNEAEEPLRKAIVLRPNFGPAHLNLGAVLMH
jgi:Flp pilus assembly protein TadD